MALTHKYITFAGAGNNDGDTWANAYTLAQAVTFTEATDPLTGYIFWMEGRTGSDKYVLGEDWVVAGDGTAAEPCAIIGVANGTSAEPPTYSDWADTTARPYIDAAGYFISWDNHARFFNLQIQTDDTYALQMDDGCFVYNCDLDSDYLGTSARDVLNLGANCLVLDTESYVSGNPTGSFAMRGINVTGSYGKIINCYVHGSATDRIPVGILGYISTVVINTIFDNCVKGFNTLDRDGTMPINCTFNDCTTGWDSTISATLGMGMINNIFNDCNTGVSGDASTTLMQIGNNFYNSGTADYVNVNVTHPYDDVKKTTVDPTFTAEAGDDFSLDTGSGCIDAGEALRVGVG